ncbi:MAG: nitroreductase family protein [Kiritimatiellia bacterium]
MNVTCMGCGKCVKDCPMWLLKLVDGRPVVREGKAGGCIGCRHCVAVCPRGAIALNGVGADDCVPTELLPVPPPNEVANLVRTRRSIRQYAASDIPRAEIEDLLETLKCVPTGCNVRHLVFKVVDSRAKLADCRRKVMELLAANLGKLPEMLQNITRSWQKNPAADAIFRGAPHVLIVYGDPQAVTPQVDCDAACAYFDLLAQAHGIGTTWCGFLSHVFAAVPEAADIFGVPRGAPFHAMLFGDPVVDYPRCVNRADGARIEWL